MALSQGVRKRIQDLHLQLLKLHKALLDDERREYEKVHGAVHGANQVLHLVMHDPWFDWLRSISRSIVQIDELLDDKKAEDIQADELADTLKKLFRPCGEDTEFLKRYKIALTREPAAVLGHIEVQKCLQLFDH